MTQASNPLPAAFKRAPVNVHTEIVAAGLAAAEAQAQAASAVAPPVQVTPAPQPASAQAAPAPMAAPAPIAAPAPQPVQAPAPAPVAPQIDPIRLAQMEAERQQLAAERQQLLDRSKAQDQAIQNLLQSQQELETLKRQQEIAKSLSEEQFAQLESIEPEDAKRIRESMVAATQAATMPLYKELAETRRLAEERAVQAAQEAERVRIQMLTQQITAKHPDFFTLQNTEEYRRFMSQRDGKSVKTRDDRAAEEFKAGNVEYVNDLLDQLKGTIPSADHIASVAPVQTAYSASLVDPAPAAPTMTLRDLNDQYQMRQISHEQYREGLKQLRAANLA